jgi:hypothetical protein
MESAAVAREQVLHRQNVGRVLLHQAAAPTQQVAHRALLFRIDVPFRQ